MDSTPQPLTSGTGLESFIATDTCLHCGEPWSRLPPVVTASLGALRRCRRCGTSAAVATGRFVRGCEICGLPFIAADSFGSPRRCEDCELTSLYGAPDAALALATTAEVLHTLSESWAFVGAKAVSGYLDRLVRQISRVIPGSPRESRVLLFRDGTLSTLGLPGGTLLISVGTLGSLENEAELSFVIGHELAHVASGHAAERLVKLGLRSMAQPGQPHGREAFKQVALDLIRLGHGRPRERQADMLAIQALLALDYDPEAAQHYLKRIEDRMDAGDPDVAELALAHPDPRDRILRIESALASRSTSPGACRVNREVFRRAVGPGALAAALAPVDPLAALVADEARSRPGLVLAGWGALGILLIVMLLWLVGWLIG